MNADEMLPPELAMDHEPLTDEDLAAYFGREDSDVTGSDRTFTEESPAGRWRVEADDQADWCLRKLAIADAEIDLRRQQAEEWKARIDAWHVEVTAGALHTVEFMRGRLEDYALRVREAGGPATIKLPAGEVKTSARQPSVKIDEEQDVAEWIAGLMTDPESWLWAACEDGGFSVSEVVKLTPKVYVGPLRKLVTIGQVSEGVWATSTLGCGHRVERQVESLYESDVPARGDMLACEACSLAENPSTVEASLLIPVEVTIVEERFRAVVVGPDGSEVPGTGVDPGGVNVTVKAR